jgi:uncharacterized repeat protein (TIGR01451 family)
VAGRAISGVLAVLLTTCLAAVAPDPTSPDPRLSITIDDGRTTAAAGTRLTYTITVGNLGTTDITGLAVTQSMPPGLELESADSLGGAHAGHVAWSVNVQATATTAVHSTMAVYETPPDLALLASVACASAAEGRRPIVCATHSDRLPAGTTVHTGWTGTSAHAGLWYFVGGLVMLCAAAVMALLLRRRRIR